MHIVVISGSVREGRLSHRVALFMQRVIAEAGHTSDLVDLKACGFPLFNERLKHQKEPHPGAVDLSARVLKSNGVILVTPEYNGGYPASVKNVVDLLTDEWKRRPVGICTVSDGSFGGSQVITSLLFSLWKIKAWVVAHMPVPKAQETFDAEGDPADAAAWTKRSGAFLKELEWAMEARRRMEA